ncbi:uncharacterized protein B0H18DRAFT_1088861 [Fomitopsis serialis]|uniref:uncharacterized protein n=1 Tax=Fomitopsis serialis TaxID=139415 RepID=UPI002007DD47|nr:uncharacterized protein B0H18DRAFT_1088861 [Neoantrodia serialis]KAH9911842.1 hypothetical protein B0H18DRAFT_1088861 [Neoantrodia serialis]
MSGGAEPRTCGLIHLPQQASLVSDADEEVFLLYTHLAARRPLDEATGFRGLGHVDSQKDTLTVEFTIAKPPQRAIQEPTIRQSRSTGRSTKKKSKVPTESREHVIAIELLQDKTALRTRKGDTGSVLWRASVDFAQYVLRSYHTRAPDTLLDAGSLSAAHVLELGAGTGLLGIALSPIVARYTLTDIDALIPLIRKNLAHNCNLPNLTRSTTARRSAHGTSGPAPKDEKHANVVVEALDWEQLRGASPALRKSSFQYPPIDVLLVVDCIYHPSLLPALLSTIDHLTTPGVTAVLVVVELRAEDVVREFLAGWLSIESNGMWQVWSVPEVLDGPYAVWVGWKAPRDDSKR